MIDPVTLAVLRGRLEQIADEMDATLYRSAFNPIIAEARDACHGLYHAQTGATLVQGSKGLPIFVGAMAAVTADTWATEIGVLSASPPRLITTLRPVAAGTSGGITPLGTLAALAGGVFIGVSAWLLAALGGQPGGVLLLAVGSVVGVVSALFDSLLGATVQRVYECRVCG